MRLQFSADPSGCLTVSIPTLAECELFAQSMARSVSVPLCIALIGTLGAGKTQWTRFFVLALGGKKDEISSPTFVLLQEYSSTPPVYHVDAYRIQDEDEMLELGIEEILDRDVITIMEWADRFEGILPLDHVRMHWELVNDSGERVVSLSSTGPHSRRVIDAFQRICTET